jgi:hypothetical protein
MFVTNRELGQHRKEAASNASIMPKRGSNRRRMTDEERAERERQMEAANKRLEEAMARSFGWR